MRVGAACFGRCSVRHPVRVAVGAGAGAGASAVCASVGVGPVVPPVGRAGRGGWCDASGTRRRETSGSRLALKPGPPRDGPPPGSVATDASNGTPEVGPPSHNLVTDSGELYRGTILGKQGRGRADIAISAGLRAILYRMRAVVRYGRFGKAADSGPRPNPPRVFVSYRRDDSSGYAGRLYADLCERFGTDNVFIDIDSLVPGSDFVDAIEETLASCDMVLVIIGRSWLSVVDARRAAATR